MQRDGRGYETYKDDLEEHLLVDLHELLVPLIDVGGLLARIGVVIGRCGRVTLVVLAPIDHFVQHSLVDLARGSEHCAGSKGVDDAHIGDWDGIGHSLLSNIFHHVLDEDRALRNVTVCSPQSA